MKINYNLLGVDEPGEAALDIEISPERAALIFADIHDEHIATPAPQDEPREERMPVIRRNKHGRRKCGQCGRPGHTARTCQQKQTSAPRQADPSRELLTEDQFDDIKHLKSTGELSSLEYARENGVSLAEVNKAVMSRNYDEYTER